MYPYPTFGTHTISGESFDLMDGIFGMAIGGIDGLLYFHALASEHENTVPLEVLNNRTAWQSDENAFTSSFQIAGPRGSQSAASAMDANGNLYFGLNNINAIACWDTAQRPLSGRLVKTLIHNDETLQFAAGMKVKRNKDDVEELWVVTNRFQVRHSIPQNSLTFLLFPATKFAAFRSALNEKYTIKLLQNMLHSRLLPPAD